MSIVRKHIRQSQEDYNTLAQFSSWSVWSLRRKRSKQNLLDDLIVIDPMIQKHMTVSATFDRNTESVLRPQQHHQYPHQHQHQPSRIHPAGRSIAKKESFRKNDMNQHPMSHRPRPARRAPFQDSPFRRVTKLRHWNHGPPSVTQPLPSLRTGTGRHDVSDHNDSHHSDMDPPYTFWRNLNARTGISSRNSIHGTKFDLTH